MALVLDIKITLNYANWGLTPEGIRDQLVAEIMDQLNQAYEKRLFRFDSYGVDVKQNQPDEVLVTVWPAELHNMINFIV